VGLRVDSIVLDIDGFDYHGPDLGIWVVVPDDVYRMLLEAGAPDPSQKPWERRDWVTGCAVIAHYINFPLGRRVMPDGSCKLVQNNGTGPIATELRLEREQIGNLRRTLKKIIEMIETNRSPPYYERHQRHIEPCRCELFEAHIDLIERRKTLLGILKSWPRTPEREKSWWHLDAARLLDGYRSVVNALAGRSAQGPAVRFIERALEVMGYRPVPTPVAIERALRRRNKDWLYQATLQSLSYYP
jgi:hypothetical protein